jgi:hypothetical protein
MYSGVGCQAMSNLTVSGHPGGYLKVANAGSIDPGTLGQGLWVSGDCERDVRYRVGPGCRDWLRLCARGNSICRGTINAVGLGGAEIGSGYGNNGNSSVLHVFIWGRDINASGTHGAGIGSGSAGSGNSSVLTLVIWGGNVTATGMSGAGIGVHSEVSVSMLAIRDANVITNLSKDCDSQSVSKLQGLHEDLLVL